MSTDNSLSADGSGPPVALIAGPTASGKSDLAVRLAQEIARRGGRGVVVNADSAQVYADLAVLSARPSPADMGGIEHRLYGAWDGAIACSAADWAEAASAQIADIHRSGAIPILVGGTGLYLRTLLDGIAPVPAIPPETRVAVRALPVAEAHAALRREDPERAARLHPTDTARVARALEVVRATGRTLASWQAERVGGIGGAVHLFPAILLPPRDWLYPRCDTRFAAMVDGGAMGEVEALLARRLDPALPVMRASARSTWARTASPPSCAASLAGMRQSPPARRPPATTSNASSPGCATSLRLDGPESSQKLSMRTHCLKVYFSNVA